MNTKVAMVTGSSKGIGQAIAIQLGSEGYHTYITYKSDKAGGEKTIEKISATGGSASLLQLDVREEDSVKKVFDSIQKEHGYLNVLVNNAGVEIPKQIEDATFQEWQTVTRTKMDGSFLCTKYAIPLLKIAENANLIFIVSSLGDKPSPDFIAYSIGTASVIAFTKAMAIQLGQYGIRTNAIAPGTTKTPMWDAMGGDNEEMWTGFAASNPMRRISTSEDIAKAASIIINDPTRYMNGNFIYMNGGGHL